MCEASCEAPAFTVGDLLPFDAGASGATCSCTLERGDGLCAVGDFLPPSLGDGVSCFLMLPRGDPLPAGEPDSLLKLPLGEFSPPGVGELTPLWKGPLAEFRPLGVVGIEVPLPLPRGELNLGVGELSLSLGDPLPLGDIRPPLILPLGEEDPKLFRETCEVASTVTD